MHGNVANRLGGLYLLYPYRLALTPPTAANKLVHSDTNTITVRPHLNVHHRLTGNCIPLAAFHCGSEAGKLPEDSQAKRGEGGKHAEDYVTQLINKLMRSRFL